MPLFGKKSDKKARQKTQQRQQPQSSAPSTAKPGRTTPWQGSIDDGTAAIHGHDVGDVRPGPTIGGAESLQRSLSDEEGRLGDLGASKFGNVKPGQQNLLKAFQSASRSRLSNTLPEVLRDNSALPYFIQYMEAVDSVQLVQFWLAVESFSNASLSSSNVLSKTIPPQNVSISSDIPENNVALPNHVNNVDTERLGVKSQPIKDTLSQDSDMAPRIQVIAATPTDSSYNALNNNDSEKVDSGYQDGDSPLVGGASKRSSSIIQDSPTSGDSRVSEESSGIDSSVTENSPVRESISSSTSSPSKSNKTHVRARSDTSALVMKQKSNTVHGMEKGHRRNNSTQSWKDVDPKTAVERDAVNIYTKFLCRDAQSPVGLPEELRSTIIDRVCPQEGMVDPDCFKEPQQFVYETMDKEFFPGYLRSVFHCKYQVDILTSGKVYLADILYNETATSYLMEYLEQEGAIHMLQFWLAASNYKQHFLSLQGQYDPQQAQDDAMVLYDQYFSLQAIHPLGFDNETRFSVESNICREGGPLPDCFEVPMRQAFTTLESVYFPGFLRSQLYYKFLSELLNSIRSESKAASTEDVVGASKPADQPHIQRKNTLLAEGTVKKLLQSDMSIDPAQLHPDTLWQRTNFGNMESFGKVDALGQFVSGFEPDPETVHKKAGGSRFSLKKLVNKEEDKAKEQMALQIAQMIINDVTIQTKTASPLSDPS